MRRVVVWVVVLAAIALIVWATQFRTIDNRVVVYFIGPADGSHTVVPVERTVRGRGVEAILTGAIEALLVGPTSEERARGLSTEIPSGTRLRSLTVGEGVATIDLSEAVGSGGGSSSLLARVWQIVYTGTQHPAAPQVRLVVEGAERRALGGEGVVIDRPIGRPPAFPRF